MPDQLMSQAREEYETRCLAMERKRKRAKRLALLALGSGLTAVAHIILWAFISVWR